MRKVLFGLVALLAITAAVNANVLVNGDFSAGENGWTRWEPAGGGRAGTWTTSSGVGRLDASGKWRDVSYGWYQVVPLPVGTVASVEASWQGQDVSWAEVMLWTEAAVGGESVRADTGAAADIAYKKDGWNLNPPTPTWSWALASLSPLPAGNFGTVVSQGYVVVALKLGLSQWLVPDSDWLEIDNVTLTPEPTALLLLGLPLLLVRRRRA